MMKNIMEKVLDWVDDWKEFFVDEIKESTPVMRVLFILLMILSVVLIVLSVLLVVSLIMHPEAIRETKHDAVFYYNVVHRNMFY